MGCGFASIARAVLGGLEPLGLGAGEVRRTGAYQLKSATGYRPPNTGTLLYTRGVKAMPGRNLLQACVPRRLT